MKASKRTVLKAKAEEMGMTPREYKILLRRAKRALEKEKKEEERNLLPF